MNSKARMAIGLVIAGAVAVAVVVVLRADVTGRGGSGLGEDYQYDREEFAHVPPELIRYREARRVELAFDEPRGLALGPDGRLFVAGDRAIHVFDPAGQRVDEIALADVPRCLDLSPDGSLYVGMKDHVEVYTRDGTRRASWADRGSRAYITSVAAGADDVFVADAGNREVVRYDTRGEVIGVLGRKDPSKGVPGIVVRSYHLDVAIEPHGFLWVSNPGRRAMEAYSFRGYLETEWGTSAQTIEGFCGCCNPTDFAILPDGRFVTSEKGIPRVKVYTAAGELDAVVAAPHQFDKDVVGLDLEADPQGNILVLDPMARAVRVFEPKSEDED
ncbi:MAG: hypothetical protein ACLF0G_09135 [Candidatus Brocadiia bacterium]